MIQAANLSIKNPKEEIIKVLKTVRMEGAAGNKYKNCSLGMKQRIGIAMALLGSPRLLILDEPINGLDADGMRIMREVLTDLAHSGTTVVISSHVLGELEKIATHYGIIKGGRMIAEMTAEELERSCRTFIKLRAGDINRAAVLLRAEFSGVEDDREGGYIRIYDNIRCEDAVEYLYKNGIAVSEILKDRISLEEYYIDLMREVKKND